MVLDLSPLLNVDKAQENEIVVAVFALVAVLVSLAVVPVLVSLAGVVVLPSVQYIGRADMTPLENRKPHATTATSKTGTSRTSATRWQTLRAAPC